MSSNEENKDESVTSERPGGSTHTWRVGVPVEIFLSETNQFHSGEISRIMSKKDEKSNCPMLKVHYWTGVGCEVKEKIVDGNSPDIRPIPGIDESRWDWKPQTFVEVWSKRENYWYKAAVVEVSKDEILSTAWLVVDHSSGEKTTVSKEERRMSLLLRHQINRLPPPAAIDVKAHVQVEMKTQVTNLSSIFCFHPFIYRPRVRYRATLSTASWSVGKIYPNGYQGN